MGSKNLGQTAETACNKTGPGGGERQFARENKRSYVLCRKKWAFLCSILDSKNASEAVAAHV